MIIMMYRRSILTVNIKIMKSGRKTGRPPTGRKGRPLQLYAEESFIAAVDEWRRHQPDIPNRSVAIRRLVESHPEIRIISASTEATKPPRRPVKRKDAPR
jgi:hypothetical protein